MLWYWKIAIYVLMLAARNWYTRSAPNRLADPWESVNYPEAEQGSPIPRVFGTRWVENPTCLWYGDLKTQIIRVLEGAYYTGL